MPAPPALRLLVLSDLHAHTAALDGGGATSLSFHGSAEAVDRLFGGIRDALDEIAVQHVDAVICPGDLTDKADETALTQVWARLCALADSLGAKLIATAGNHDHDSRADGGFDPMTYLKQLDPPFPVREEHESLRYFARNFARIDTADHTFISVNSGALGGYQGPDGDEYRHGRVQPADMKQLSRSLQETPPRRTRVLVIHHHPVQLPAVDLNEHSRIKDAELLLDLLGADGSWLIIHGHKHRPWIQYAPGGGGSPVLFSAGSFSAPLDGVLAQSTKNQFYLLDLITDSEAVELDLGTAGRFRAWSHSPMAPKAWVPSGSTDGLPAAGGFGWRADPWRLASRVRDHVIGAGKDVDFEGLIDWEPRLPFLSPDDLAKLARHLAFLDAEMCARFDAEGQLLRIEYSKKAES